MATSKKGSSKKTTKKATEKAPKATVAKKAKKTKKVTSESPRQENEQELETSNQQQPVASDQSNIAQGVSSEPADETNQINQPIPDKKNNKRILGLLLIVGIIVLVAFESYWILHQKVIQQAELVHSQMIGKRGGPPEEVGEFWGPGKIIVDKINNRIVMLDVNYWKAIYWNISDGSHIIDLNKYGRHEIGFEKNKERLQDFRPGDGAFDGEGNLYILDIIHSEVTVVSKDYKIQGTWNTPPARSLTADYNGNVYIIEAVSRQIVQYDGKGQELKRFGKGRLSNPGFMAADEQGHIYVVDKGAKKIVVFDNQGKEKNSWKLKVFDPIGNPDIDVVNNKVFLCEHDNQTIAVYTKEGKLLHTMKAAYPAVIGVDKNETIYISEGAGIAGYTVQKKY